MTKEKVHHAVVFEGDGTACREAARGYIRETLHLTVEANPDVTVYTIGKYKVQDARQLKERASQTPLGSTQVFVLSFETITSEAQNALLKLLEEPAPDTFFVLTVPTIYSLLPTVRSRLSYGKRVAKETTDEQTAISFLAASASERSAMIARILDNKDRPAARKLVDTIETYLHADGVQKHATQLRELAFVRNYLSDRSSSLKMLLEHLIVTI